MRSGRGLGIGRVGENGPGREGGSGRRSGAQSKIFLKIIFFKVHHCSEIIIFFIFHLFSL